MDERYRLNHLYHNMKLRCIRTEYKQRGITICKEWLEDFHAFKLWALQNGYKEGLTLDRIDNNKGYYPENCRWVTMKVQNNNKSNNRLITYKEQTKTLAQWSEELGINKTTLHNRLTYYGWSIEEALGGKHGQSHKSGKL